MWTSTWRWNMTVRVKQKHLILTPQHHWSPTTSHPPPPPHHSPLPTLMLLIILASGNFLKIGKKRVIICISNMCFWDLKHKLLLNTKADRGFVLDSEQKLRHSYNQFGLRVVFKKLEHNITYEKLTNKTFQNLHHNHHKLPFWNLKRAKKTGMLNYA